MTSKSEIVEMTRDAGDPGERHRYSCSLEQWTLMLELGKEFGWRAHGATYLRRPASLRGSASMRHNYIPGDSRDAKCVDGKDAAAFAASLERAHRSPHFGALTRQTAQVVPTSFEEMLGGFIAYATAGEFSFAMASKDALAGGV
jgi:hypothetical protein